MTSHNRPSRGQPTSARLIITAATALMLIFCLAPPAFGQRGQELHRFDFASAMTDRDVDRFAPWLELDAQQDAQVRVLLDAYRRRFAAATSDRMQYVRDVWNASEAERFQRMRDAVMTYDAVQQRAEAIISDPTFDELQHAGAMNRGIVAVEDDRFFAEIEALLNDDQKDGMRRVRMWRQRSIVPSGHVFLREAQIDLVNMIRIETDPRPRTFTQQEPAFMVVTPSEYRALAPVLDLYEPMLIFARQQYGQTMRRIVPLGMASMEISRAMQRRQVTADERAALSELHDQYNRPMGLARMQPLRELERINRMGLSMFMDHLPQDKAQTLQQMYLETAYPTVYVDPVSLHALFDSVRALDTLKDAQRDAIEALQGAYETSYANLSQQMADAESEMIVIRVTMRGGDSEKSSYMSSEQLLRLAELGMERERLAEHAIAQLVQQLSTEQLASVLSKRWLAETSSVHTQRADRNRRPSGEPHPIHAAMLLRGVSDDARRTAVLNAAAAQINQQASTDDQRVLSQRLLEWDYLAVEPPRPWYRESQVEYMQRSKQAVERLREAGIDAQEPLTDRDWFIVNMLDMTPKERSDLREHLVSLDIARTPAKRLAEARDLLAVLDRLSD